jgi:hypothetical protein
MLYRVAVPGRPDAVCSAELNFTRGPGDGQWSVCAHPNRLAAGGVFVSGDMSFGGLLIPGRSAPQAEPKEGELEEGSDLRSLELLSASEGALNTAGWSKRDGLGWASFLVPQEPVRVGQLDQDPESGLFLGIIPGFSALWVKVGLVSMRIACFEAEPCKLASMPQEPLDPHITLVRRVMDTCVNSSHGGCALVGELLSRFFVHSVAASMVVACELPPPVRWWVHDCLSGLESVTPCPLEVTRVRAAKQALQSHSAAAHIQGLGVLGVECTGTVGHRAVLEGHMRQWGLPGLHYGSAIELCSLCSVTASEVLLFEIGVSSEFTDFMGVVVAGGYGGHSAEPGYGGHSLSAEPGEGTAIAGAASGAGAGTGHGEEPAPVGFSGVGPSLLAIAFDGGVGEDGDTPKAEWISLTAAATPLPPELSSGHVTLSCAGLPRLGPRSACTCTGPLGTDA